MSIVKLTKRERDLVAKYLLRLSRFRWIQKKHPGMLLSQARAIYDSKQKLRK